MHVSQVDISLDPYNNHTVRQREVVTNIITITITVTKALGEWLWFEVV